MRDYIFILVMAVSLPLGFVRPYYGMLLYTWLSFMYPQALTFSLADVPWAKMAAVTTIVGTVARGAGSTAPLRQRESVLMVLLWCTFNISTIFAINPSSAWTKWEDVSKLILMGLLTSTLLTEKSRMRYFLLTIALSLGFYGLKGGLFSLLTRGAEIVWGPSTSIIGGNNNIGLALNMCLPFLWYLAHEERGVLKIVLYSAFYLSIPGIMFTNSRASALTIPIVLAAIVLKGRSRTLLVCTGLVAALVAVPLIPDKFWDRQESVLSYESDRSSMSRIDNWQFCWKLALDLPLTGAGFNFNTRETFEKYAPQFLFKYQGKTWDTHNIYMAMLASHGFPGLLFFVAMIASCFVSCARMQYSVRQRKDLSWLASYCCIVQVSFVALLVNGMFVNMEYFDLVYDLVAVVAGLKVICRRALSETADTEIDFEGHLIAAATS